MARYDRETQYNRVDAMKVHADLEADLRQLLEKAEIVALDGNLLLMQDIQQRLTTLHAELDALGAGATSLTPTMTEHELAIYALSQRGYVLLMQISRSNDVGSTLSFAVYSKDEDALILQTITKATGEEACNLYLPLGDGQPLTAQLALLDVHTAPPTAPTGVHSDFDAAIDALQAEGYQFREQHSTDADGESFTMAVYERSDVATPQPRKVGMKLYRVDVPVGNEDGPSPIAQIPLKELAEQSAYGFDDNETIDAISDLAVGETYTQPSGWSPTNGPIYNPTIDITVTRIQ